MKLAACHVIVVRDNRALNSVRTFFQALFDDRFIAKSVPCNHHVLKFPDNAVVVLVNAASCDKEVLVPLSNAAVNQIIVSVDDLETIQSRATEVGGNVTESNALSCCIEGPEGLRVHAFCCVSTKSTLDVMYISSLISVSNEIDDDTGDGGEKRQNEVGALSDKRKKLTRRPQFNSLDVTLFSHSVYASHKKSEFIPFTPNSEPTPFETDLFVGSAFLAIRTDPMDGKYDKFFTDTPTKVNKRMFEVQVQGRFKKVPDGPIYVGADALFRLELGLLTRTFVKAVLSFLKTLVNNLHYSFGESKSTEGYETAHVVAPLFSTMDKITFTPTGGVPPSMGIPFPDDLELRKIRLDPSRCDSIKISTEGTYSFSLNSNNIDLPGWEVMGIPMLKPLSINLFSGGGPFSLVAYEVPRGPQGKRPLKHSYETIKYILNMQIASIDKEGMPDVEFVEIEEFDDVDRARRNSIHRLSSLRSSTRDFHKVTSASNLNEMYEEEDEDEDDNISFCSGGDSEQSDDELGNLDFNSSNISLSVDERTTKSPQLRTTLISRDKSSSELPHVKSPTKTKRFENWFRREVSERLLGVVDVAPAVISEEKCEKLINDTFTESLENDLRYCPGVVELDSHTNTNGNKRCYFLLACTGPLVNETSPKLRTFQEISKVFRLAPSYTKLSKKVASTSNEQRRRHIAFTLKGLCDTIVAAPVDLTAISVMSKLEELLGSETAVDKNFLSQSYPRPSQTATGSESDHPRVCDSQTTPAWEGNVALCTDRRVWSECNLVVSNSGFSITQSVGLDGLKIPNYNSKTKSTTVSKQSILFVRVLDEFMCPFPGFYYFEVETIFQVYIFMVKRQSDATSWVTLLTELFGKYVTERNIQALGDNFSMPDFDVDMILGRPRSLKLGKRRVLNFRRVVFPSRFTMPVHLTGLSPNRIVEMALDEAFHLLDDNTNAQIWVQFMDSVSALQVVDLSALSLPEKLSFLLNLYHVMVIHGMLILGPPLPSNWESFFDTVSYLVGYDVVSIKELECNGLRSSMSNYSNLLGKRNKTKSVDLGYLALNENDFRLNFCINCGSRCTTSFVPIYTPEHVDEQMDTVTALVLAETAQIDVINRTVVLPRVCSWYLRDFCVRPRQSDGNGIDIGNGNGKALLSLKRSFGGNIVNATGITGATLPVHCLKVIAPYLRIHDMKALLLMLQDDIGTVNIRFRPFSFRSHFLQRYVT